MPEIVAILVSLLALAMRRRPQPVRAPSASFVLPAVVAPARPRRLARGSIAQPAPPMPDELARRRPVIRPSHARR